MSQVFEQPELTSSLVPKQSVEDIIREWVIMQCSVTNEAEYRNVYKTLEKIQRIADEGSFEPEINLTMLEIINTYINDKNPFYETVMNNRYIFSVNGVVLKYVPTGMIPEYIWQIVKD